MSLVLWNDLCPEFFQRLTVGTVLYLQNYTLKQSYSNRSHPQMDHHRMKNFTSVGMYSTFSGLGSLYICAKCKIFIFLGKYFYLWPIVNSCIGNIWRFGLSCEYISHVPKSSGTVFQCPQSFKKCWKSKWKWFSVLSYICVTDLVRYTLSSLSSTCSHCVFSPPEICLNPHNPASIVTVVSPKSVTSQWGLPDVAYQFTTRWVSQLALLHCLVVPIHI